MAETLTAVQALAKVMADVQAVRKSDRNQQQNFNFRGVDAVVNAVGPALRRHGVVVGSEVLSHSFTEVEVGQRRTPMGHAMVTVRYRFYGPAGDFVEASAAAEAMDSGDKATPKAMSVAYRTALIQALCLPTDEPDPDAQSYERAPRERQGARRQTPTPDVNALKAEVAKHFPGLTKTQLAETVSQRLGKPAGEATVEDLQGLLTELVRGVAA